MIRQYLGQCFILASWLAYGVRDEEEHWFKNHCLCQD